MKRLTVTAAAVTTALLMGGCGGSESNSDTLLSGTFVDAPVEGVYYNCLADGNRTKEGMTDLNGTFQYPAGAKCTFRIGQLILGTVQIGTTKRVTPYDLAENNVTVASNIASLIQTLDQNRSDGYLSIPSLARSGLESNATNLRLSANDFNLSVAAIAKRFGTTVVDPATAKGVMDAYLKSIETPSNGGNGATLTCNTDLFQKGAPVTSPSASDLTAFSGSYAADEGTLDSNFNFTVTGNATVTLSDTGALSYKGNSYTATSACVETLSGGTKQLVMHTEKGHLDFGSDKKSINGISPVDGTTVVRTHTATGGNPATGITLSKAIGGVDTLANTQSTVKTTTNADTNVTSNRAEWGDLLSAIKVVTVHAYMPNYMGMSYDSLTVNIAKAGTTTLSAQLDGTNGGMCLLSWSNDSLKNTLKPCADLGINYDKGTGKITFTDTVMKDMVGGNGTFSVKGSLGFTPY